MILIFLISLISKLQTSTSNSVPAVRHFYQFENNSIKYVIQNYVYPENFEIKNLIEERYTISSLVFRDCKVVKMPADIFKTLKSLEDLNMSRSGLDDLGDVNFQNARHLKHFDASFNNITKLDVFSFSGALSVTRLDLSHNEISELQIGSLKGLVKLSILNLSFNKITKLGSKFLFYDNQDLTEIKLNDNRIHTIVNHPGPFSSLKKLTFLYLNNNFLTDFQHADLTVESLSIGNNKLTGLMITNHVKKISAPENMISSLYIISPFNKVESIWIDRNNITDIKSLAQFSKMLNLVYLQASFNPIKDLTPIADNIALESLFLSFTQRKKIDFKIFSNLKLKEFDYSYNDINKIDFNEFQLNENLIDLDLNGNSLKELDLKKMTEKFPSIKKIHITNNFFNCSFLESIFNYTDLKSIEVADDPQHNLSRLVKSVRKMACFDEWITPTDADGFNVSPSKSFEAFEKALSPELSILEHFDDEDDVDFEDDDELNDLMERHLVLERNFHDFVNRYNTLAIFVGLLLAGIISLVIFKVITFYLKRRSRIIYSQESRPFNEFINDDNLN